MNLKTTSSLIMPNPQFLLLLPPIPEPATYPAIKAGYHAPLLEVLKQLKETVPGRSIIDIALPCPHLWNASDEHRKTLYQITQKVLSNVYKLICIIAAQRDIEVADVDGDSIDVRILLLGYPRNGDTNTTSPVTGSFLGPVIHLDLLARSRRAWQTVFSVETEYGQRLLNNFKKYATNSSYSYRNLRGGVVQVSTLQSKPEKGGVHICNSVAVGGTFDHLHIGHKLLLTMTLFTLDPPTDAKSKKKVMTIGITAEDLLAKKKYAELLQPWDLRTERTRAFVRAITDFSPPDSGVEKSEEIRKPGPNGHAVVIQLPWSSSILELRYVEIWDPFGPTITDSEIDTIVVSGETRSGGKAVNDKRNEAGMSTLEIFEVDVLDAEEESGNVSENNFQSKLSSSEIRKVQAEKLKSRSKV
jgi:phosphopantetheine adenylyltransferase